MSAIPDRRIPLSVPHLAGNERAYLEECLRTNFVSSVGPFVERFENAFAAYLGSPRAIACASGTAALHVAMRLLGVGPGHEVLAQDFTFVASINPILYERATPVLVDSEPATWNLDPQRVVAEIERRARAGHAMPRAVVVVHILGHPVEIEPIAEACEKHGIPLVEDAAESLGARYTTGRFAGRHVGTVGVIGCFSFNGNKVVTTGGGGMLVTRDDDLARRAAHLVRQARLPGPEYLHDEVGYNYRMTNLAAALGLAQLEQLDGFLERKQRIASIYDAALQGLPGVTLAPRARWARSSLWLYSILLDPASARLDRRQLLEALANRGIESRPVWCPAHLMAPYRDLPYLGGKTAERIHEQGLSLPSSSGLSDEDARQVAGSLVELLSEGRQR